MKILLVEDDPAQLKPIHSALIKAGHIVDAVLDGETAQWLVSDRSYDLLVLDWMLPHISGIELCQQYRRLGKTTPVLFLTAKDEILDKITGLDAGADDYLVKPVNLNEFLARVRALGRRSPLWVSDRLSLGDLDLNLSTLTLTRQDKTVNLSGREFQLMEYLLRHPQQVLTRDQIEQALWEWDRQPESKAVAILVHRVRQRLQSLQADHWLQTIYGMGYRLMIPETEQ
ncbi:MAG: response regulator transcription factor [Synechococcales cyanobacterium K44_A2020_017]|mgnify:CR=1 FL=1|uniref:response regulator transcription factor n=1 Tax=Leptolyngbya sp. CCY15150 TaxID=2767772 RepID=UPI001950B3E1|nr:response regulator transcription factor [Leptolyngbya sp. CCY15150]MBF2089339.1 response regulator transcription factor [Synechococcales cyanobacterium K32_A2020_035]MBF2095484.1 response regulator transcription factor [Synechococcales cyanobacterium K44_A2020_017]